MQIKPTMWYHLTLTRTPIIKQSMNNAGEDADKGNSLILLVGMHTGTATMENSVETPLKTGNRTAIRHSNPTAGHTH